MKVTARRSIFYLLISLLLGACEGTPDEEQIAQNIAAMQEAIEAKNFVEIKDYLHDDFIGNDRLSVMEVKQMLQMYGSRHKSIGITIVDSTTVMDTAFTDRAESTLSVLFTGSSGLLPTDGSVRTVKVSWLKESGDWLVTRANWQHYQGQKRF